MSEELFLGYHLSTEQQPVADAQGLFKVLPAEFVFNHWQAGQRYLHQLRYPQQAISDYCEDGHHDGISSFSFDEFVMIDHFNSVTTWQLDNKKSLFSLLESPFVSELKSAIFCNLDPLHRAVFSLATAQLAIDYIRQLPLTKEALFDCLTLDNIDLARALLHANLVEESDFCGYDLQTLDWQTMTIKADDFMAESLADKLGLNDSLEALIFALFDKQHPPQSSSLCAQMIALALLKNQPWKHYLDRVDNLSLPSGLIVQLVRELQITSVEEVLLQPKIKLEFNEAEKSCDYLLDRLAVYQQLGLLKSFENRLAGFDNTQTMRLLSSLSAVGMTTTDFAILDTQQLLNWQQSQLTLEQAAQSGYLFVIEQLLSKAEQPQEELDAALLAAAKQGYTEIVKRLQQHGGSLEVAGRWPIRYANKYGYQSLKNYLLAQDQEDLYF